MSEPAVLVRYWAAAKAAAGTPEERYPAVVDLGGLLDAIRRRHGQDSRLTDVLQRCSYLVDEVSPGRRAPSDVAVPPGATVDVLPPFAGGSGDDRAPRTAPGTQTRTDGLAPA